MLELNHRSQILYH